MRVVCVLLRLGCAELPSLAEACLVFTPQIALSGEAVFLEIEASQKLFTVDECFARLREILDAFGLSAGARVACAPDIPSALACARYGCTEAALLPVEALADFVSPFAPAEFTPAPLLRKLGLHTLGDFRALPAAEIASRFGRDGLLAHSRLSAAPNLAWPRFLPPERIVEEAELDFAARIETLAPVFFLLKRLVDRAFLRLYARAELLAAFRLTFRLNKLARGGARERITEVRLPLPQGEPKSVLSFLQERIAKELELRPLEDALEGIRLEVRETAPARNAQRDFFSKVEEEREAWASLVARLAERLGNSAPFLAAPAPRLRPEAAWTRGLDPGKPELMPKVPLRPLRLLREPLPLRREGDRLSCANRRWEILAIEGPERLRGEWWLGGFARDYYQVATVQGERLWVFQAAGGDPALFLHGIYD